MTEEIKTGFKLYKLPKTPEAKEAENLPVNETMVKMIEALLERAKKGEVNHVILISLGHDNTVYDGWSYPEDCKPHTMLGAVHSLAFDLTNLTIERRTS